MLAIDRKLFRKIKDQKGSVLLAILSMATIGSIAMLAMMFSIKSVNNSLALKSLQNKAHQELLRQHDKRISNYLANRSLTDSSNSSIIKKDGIEFTYKQFPNQILYLNSPIPGFSHDSNYTSKLIRFKSQITREIIQSQILLTEIACIDVIAENLNNNKQIQYSVQMASAIEDSLHYEFNDQTGQVWKNTSTTSKLFLDLDFSSAQSFSRVDLATVNVSGKIKLAMIFAVHNTENPSTNRQNALYILFDDLFSEESASIPLSSADLINLTNGYVTTGQERGFTFPLDSGQLLSSTITTVHNNIIVIAQSSKRDQQHNRPVLETKLYMINLTPDDHRNLGMRLIIRRLSDSVKPQNLVTTLVSPNQLTIGTESDPLLVNLPVHCKQISVYEE